jgi:hypothetical protein
MAAPDPALALQDIDAALFARHPLQALLLIKQSGDLTLERANQLLFARYQTLRRESPERFGCDDAAYWRNWLP